MVQLLYTTLVSVGPAQMKYFVLKFAISGKAGIVPPLLSTSTFSYMK